MVDATKAYVEATSLSVKFLIAKNKCMAKELEVARQREEQSIGSSRAEMKMAIVADVLALETVTQRFYGRFVIVHNAFVHLHAHQQHCTKIKRTLIDIHATVNHVQTWTIGYKGAPLHLHKMTKP